MDSSSELPQVLLSGPPKPASDKLFQSVSDELVPAAFVAKLVFWVTRADRDRLSSLASRLRVSRAMLLRRAVFHGLQAAVLELSMDPPSDGRPAATSAAVRTGPRRQSAVSQFVVDADELVARRPKTW